MNKKDVEKYIPIALKVLNKKFNEGVMPKAYNGYISSFGASIIQSGLLPTLALFENKQAHTKADKTYLTKILLKILDENSDESSLLKYVLNSEIDRNILKNRIIAAATAVKLAIRTFKLEDMNNG